jgi:RHS repeat-associated protein
MSRLTSETNPESGTTTYTYDSDATCGASKSDLVKRVDANGNVTCYQYDSLHRTTSVTYSSGPNAAATPTKTFVYDTTSFNCPTGANVLGRLAEAYTGPSTAKMTDLAYCYSPRGEVTDIYTGTQSFSGYNHITKTYWPSGQLQQLSGVPGMPTIYYGASDGSGLDGEGRITKITAASGPNPIACSTAPCVSYNSAGQVTNLIFGSGDSDSYTYDANTGRMTQYQFNVNGQSAVGTAGWNANGTLASLNVTDAFNSGATQNCTYAHDDLSRLASVNCPNVWSQTFSYDPFGNLTKSGSYWWQPGYNSATNRYTLAGTQYDNNGNLLNDTFHTYQWDAEGNIVAVDVGGSNYTDYLTYDAMGNMAEYKQTYPNNPAWLAQLVYGAQGPAHAPLGKTIAGGGTTFELPLVGGAKMAAWSGSGTTAYGHADWLGSIRLNSTPSRTVISDVVFAPFAEVYNSPTTYWYEFAGLSSRLASNVWDADVRSYHANQGRWISPDPGGLAAVDPTNPQSWNRYAYASNDPVDNIDPGGQCDTSSDCWLSTDTGTYYIAPNASWVGFSGPDPTSFQGCGQYCGMAGLGYIIQNDQVVALFAPGSGSADTTSFSNSLASDSSGGSYCGGCYPNADPTDAANNLVTTSPNPQPTDALTPFATAVFSNVYQRAGFLTNPRFVVDFYLASASLGEGLSAAGLWEGAGLLPRLTNVSEHAFARMAQNKVSMETLQEVLTKGTKYLDPKNKTVQYIYNGIRASANPKTGLVTTVTRGAKLISKRFIPIP